MNCEETTTTSLGEVIGASGYPKTNTVQASSVWNWSKCLPDFWSRPAQYIEILVTSSSIDLICLTCHRGATCWDHCWIFKNRLVYVPLRNPAYLARLPPSLRSHWKIMQIHRRPVSIHTNNCCVLRLQSFIRLMFSGMKLYNPSERKVVVQNTIRMTSTALSSEDP